jgi:hypothetical protein
MGTTVVAGHYLQVLVSRPPVAVLILDARVGEVNVSVVVRQVVLASPPGDLLRLAIGPAIAVVLSSIALVEEPLIVALEFVVEDDTVDAATLFPQSLLCTLVGSIDLGVVRQLARLSNAGVEGLARLVATIIALVAIGFQEVAPAIAERHGTVVGTERRRANQTFVRKVLEASPGTLGVFTQVMKIALGDYTKRADRRQRAALGAVDLVDAVALSDRSTFMSARQVEILREHVA